MGSLASETRDEIAKGWLSDAQFEHASIASFSRFSLELMAAGAPADLVMASHQAALDEVRHARACFALAAAYAGSPVGAGPLPVPSQLEVTCDLASIAARTAHEGCIGETIAAVLAAERLARATDPAVRAVLEFIAADEARHAELAWRTVAWAIREGGAPVRDAVAAALEVHADPHAMPVREGELEAHGILSEPLQRFLVAQTIREVVEPAVRTLLCGSATRSDAVALEARIS
jgi:hypothetical protein